MKYNQLKEALDAAMNDALTSKGFILTTPGSWIRRSGCDLNIIELQRLSSGEAFCVNLGIHYSFLPKTGTEASLEDSKVELLDCEILLRLTELPTENDQWWPISEASVAKVAELVFVRALPVFELYRVDGALSAIDPKSLENGAPSLLAKLTNVRACLLVARLHEYFGNREKCIEAATIGLNVAGWAVGPKKALKDILKRSGQPT